MAFPFRLCWELEEPKGPKGRSTSDSGRWEGEGQEKVGGEGGEMRMHKKGGGVEAYTLRPTPYTPHPAPHTPHPTPYTPHPTWRV